MPTLAGLTVLAVSRTPEAYRARLRLEPECPSLTGHFPTHPILPGIAHLSLALDGCRELLGKNASLSALHALRFRLPLTPGDIIDLTVTRPPDAKTVRFELRRAEALASSGSFVLAEDADA
jgi:3-hydroxymyristoyl/3-hydroxydecanoyl-(acyl carrier protein) dehydratase